MGGSSDYEATDSGPSMSYSPGPSSYSTSVPNTAVETPHTMLLPSIPSSTMGSNTTAQVSKTIHKNIPTIQRKRSREKLDPSEFESLIPRNVLIQ